MVDTAHFDLNLVRVFVLLYEHRSVSATADALYLSQPTVSYSLGKLRRHFDDELFRRGRQGLVSTALADRLYEPLQRSLAEIQHVSVHTHTFDPANSQANFAIGLSDLGRSSLLPRALEALQREAPGVSLAVHPLELNEAPHRLGQGELDAFIATPTLTAPQIRRIPLFSEGYLAMVSAEHPRLDGESVDVTELQAEQHILVDDPTGHVGSRLALRNLELLDRVRVRVAEYSVLPYLVWNSELVAIVPEHAGRVYAASSPLRLLDLPIGLDQLEVALYTLPERSRDPSQRWLVEFLTRILTDRRDEPDS